MSAAEMLGYVLAGAVGCVAVVLVLTGIRNTIYAVAFARQARIEKRLQLAEDRLDAFLDTVLAVQTKEAESVALVGEQIDVLTNLYMKLRMAMMTPDELAAANARLLADVRALDMTEPGPPEPGSVDHTMPPTDVTDSEGKA